MRPGEKIFGELLARRWDGPILQEDLSFGNCFTPCPSTANVRCYSHPKAALMSGEDRNASYFSILHSFCVFVGALLTEQQNEEFTL